MKEIKIYKNDVLKSIYFIVRLTQNQDGQAMFGTLSGKSDLMGGIFDRFINILPESIIFNKGILPEISGNKKVEVITDFYLYKPELAGIAPDVIGLRVNGKAIPIVQFDERWIQVDERPLIELKTFKKKDYMISLRNQGYDDKYLVMVESNFNVDYLIPFMDNKIFHKSIFDEMVMDDDVFIVSNKNNLINSISPVIIDNDCIGSVSLLKITRSDCFMNMSTHCEGNVSVEWLKSIIELNKTIKKPLNIPLSNYCYQTQYGLYRFSDLWYDGLSDNGIPYKTTKKKNGQVILTKLRTLDFYTDKINSLIVLKKNKSNLIVMATEDLIFNDTKLFAGIPYQINYMVLARESNPGEEYFMQKSIMDFIPSFEDEMKLKLKNLIDD